MKRLFTAGLLLSVLLTVGAARTMDIPLPFRPREIAAKAGKMGLPAGVISAERNALKISAPFPVKLPQTVTFEDSASVPPQAAGQKVELRLKVSGKDLVFGSGSEPGVTVQVAGQAIPLPQGTFKNQIVSVKITCPAGGKLPIAIGVKSFSGTLWIKDPVARIDLPSSLPLPRKRK